MKAFLGCFRTLIPGESRTPLVAGPGCGGCSDSCPAQPCSPSLPGNSRVNSPWVKKLSLFWLTQSRCLSSLSTVLSLIPEPPPAASTAPTPLPARRGLCSAQPGLQLWPPHPCQARARERGSLPPRFLLENLQKSLLLPVEPEIARSWVINHWLFSSEQAMDVFLAQEYCRAEGNPTEATESHNTHLHTRMHPHTLTMPILWFRKASAGSPAELPTHLSQSSWPFWEGGPKGAFLVWRKGSYSISFSWENILLKPLGFIFAI